MRLAGHVERKGDTRGGYWVFVVRPEGKTGCRCENNIKVDLKWDGEGGMDGIDVDQDRDSWGAVVNVVMKFLCSIKFGEDSSLAKDLLDSQQGLCSMELDS
jgi:hypothetical protein